MEQFLALLLAYCTCDTTAQSQEKLGGQRLACVETYEEVKAFFAAIDPAPVGSVAYGAQRIETYRAVTAWQAENAEIVSALRAEARAAAGD